MFVAAYTRLVDLAGSHETCALAEGGKLLEDLVRRDHWLPQESARPHPHYYQQHLLHSDPLERISSLVWEPGQAIPVYDHTIWGLIGVMRGAERCRRNSGVAPGSPLQAGAEQRLAPAGVDRVLPTVGDIHEVANALKDQISISIQVYCAKIGAVCRHVFDPRSGAAKSFGSGYSYSSASIPSFWERAAEVRASSKQAVAATG